MFWVPKDLLHINLGFLAIVKVNEVLLEPIPCQIIILKNKDVSVHDSHSFWEDLLGVEEMRHQL